MKIEAMTTEASALADKAKADAGSAGVALVEQTKATPAADGYKAAADPFNLPDEMTPAQYRAVVADFQLHVLLVQKQEKVSKTKATITAWYEGREGLAMRLTPPTD